MTLNFQRTIIFLILTLTCFTGLAAADTLSYRDKIFGVQYRFTEDDTHLIVVLDPDSVKSNRRKLEDLERDFGLTRQEDGLSLLNLAVLSVPDRLDSRDIARAIQTMDGVHACTPALRDHENRLRYFVPDRAVVQFQAGVPSDAASLLIQEMGVRIVTEHWTPGLYTVEVDPDHLFSVIRGFTSLPQVRYAELNYVDFNTMDYVPDDPRFISQWYIHNEGSGAGPPDIDLDGMEAWDMERGDPAVLIAVIDDGFDWAHEELRPNLANNLLEDADGDGHTIELIAGDWVLDPGDLNGVDDDGNGKIDDLIGWDFMDEDNNPQPEVGEYGIDDHGTCVAGIAVAAGDNGYLMAGVAHGCSFLPIRHTSHCLIYTDKIDAVNYAVSFLDRYNGVVINGSWHVTGDSTGLHDAIANAKAAGAVVCFSSGNYHHVTGGVTYPGKYDECISVGAMNYCNELITLTSCEGEDWDSAWGPELDIAAFGTCLLTTDITGREGHHRYDYYELFGGTSGAVPQVTAAAALLLSYDPTLSPDKVQEILQQSAEKVPGYDFNHDPARPGHSLELGYGRLNIDRALKMLLARTGGITDLLPSPQDLVLSLDRSLSMNPDKMRCMKHAATQVIYLLNPEDELGITMFNDTAESIFPPGGGTCLMDSTTDKRNAALSLATIFAAGTTSIGGGLQTAMAQFAPHIVPTFPQNILLMSDGQENTEPWVSEVLRDVPTHVNGYSVGFGASPSEYAEESLQAIADETGGTYFFAGIDSKGTNSLSATGLIPTFQTALNTMSNREITAMRSGISTGSVVESVLVDPGSSDVRISFLWDDSGAKYNFWLYSPDGRVIDPAAAKTDPDIDYISIEIMRSYTIRDPEPGKWYAVATGSQTEYWLSAAVYSALKSHLNVETFGTVMPPRITARITDMGYAVTGASCTVRILLPYGETAMLTLYDDGCHFDKNPKDGIYANILDTANLAPGTYTVTLDAAGKTLTDKSPFERIEHRSVYIDPQGTFPMQVAYPEMHIPPGTTFLVPVLVNTDVYVRDIRKFGVRLTYDPDVIRPTGEIILQDTMSDGMSVTYTQSASDQVRLKGYGAKMEGAGKLAVLEFKTVGKPGEMSPLTMSGLTLSGSYGTVAGAGTSGSVTIGEYW